MACDGIMVVRDEGDIIGEVLAHVMSWADSLHVHDTGSSDGTWEVVREWAARERRGGGGGGGPSGMGIGWRGWMRTSFFTCRRGSLWASGSGAGRGGCSGRFSTFCLRGRR